ncbi:MAG: hypothetical protein J5705_04725 [Bacteroidaceae bacterium]|nr:hypothetical protein [Bacteroidaceae bacterium]
MKWIKKVSMERTRTKNRRRFGNREDMMTLHMMMSLDPFGDQGVVINPGFMGNSICIIIGLYE